MHTRGRISVRQLATLTKPGVYSDGGGLYLRVRNSGSRSWLFICMVRGRRRELGLGSVHDVSLAMPVRRPPASGPPSSQGMSRFRNRPPYWKPWRLIW